MVNFDINREYYFVAIVLANFLPDNSLLSPADLIRSWCETRSAAVSSGVSCAENAARSRFAPKTN